MNDNHIRPIEHLRRIKAEFPELSKMVEAAYSVKAITKHWPNWCFIPRHIWVSVIDTFRKGYLDNDENLPMVMQSHVLAAWRYGQGIYEFDPELYAALVDSEMPGKLPADVLMRLPEWCIYIPMPGLKFFTYDLHGFFASLDFSNLGDNDENVPSLEITVDTSSDELMSMPLPLINGTISEAFERVANYHKQHVADGGMEDVDIINFRTLEEHLRPLISMLLYLCSDTPEIDNQKKPGTSPFRAQAKKVKGGFKMFPAVGPTIWSVGAEIGETLRKAGYFRGGKSGHHKRPHLRRAHWHGFWTGPRTGDRQFTLKWLPPTMVAADNAKEPDVDEPTV